MQKGGDGRVIFRILLIVDGAVARVVDLATRDLARGTTYKSRSSPDAHETRALEGLCAFAHAAFSGGKAMFVVMMQ